MRKSEENEGKRLKMGSQSSKPKKHRKREQGVKKTDESCDRVIEPVHQQIDVEDQQTQAENELLYAQKLQLEDQLAQCQHALRETRQKMHLENQQLQKTLSEQAAEREELQRQLRESEGKLFQAGEKISSLECQLLLCHEAGESYETTSEEALKELRDLTDVYRQAKANETLLHNELEQLEDKLAQSQQLTETLQEESRKLESHSRTLQEVTRDQELRNQLLEKAMSEQAAEREELQRQVIRADAERRTALEKADEVAKLQESRANTLKELWARMEDFGNRNCALERTILELSECNSALENELDKAKDKINEYFELAGEAQREKEVALSSVKRLEETLEEKKESSKQFSEHQIEALFKDYKQRIENMAEQLSALELTCAEKEAQLERSAWEKRHLEEKLEVYEKYSSRENNLQEMDALRQRCLDAEKMKEEMSIKLNATLQRAEFTNTRKLSACQIEVQQLQDCLAESRVDRVKLGKDLEQMREENAKISMEMHKMRLSGSLVQDKAARVAPQGPENLKALNEKRAHVLDDVMSGIKKERTQHRQHLQARAVQLNNMEKQLTGCQQENFTLQRKLVLAARELAALSDGETA